MRFKMLGPAVAASSILLMPATASADYAHVVMPGETLTSIAATDGLSISSLAAANGISPYAELQAGSIVEIPPQSAATTPATEAATIDASSTADEASSSTSGSYVVQPGDTLTAIAERDGTTVNALAAANGLDRNGILPIGLVLTMPASGTVTSAASTGSTEYVSNASTGSSGGPYPTAERVSGSEIASIAAADGVPSSLAQAIGWQESGWNNDEVSGVGAVGVMQIVPSTWQWIQAHEAGGALEPASATDNVRGGVLLLRSLLSVTGSESMAAAGYYQGLASIRAHGLYPSTRRYVASVMALQQRFADGG